jgi:hypothetical protein
VSKREGIREEPVLLRLLMCRQLQSGGCGLVRGAHPLLVAGNSWSGLIRLSQEVMVKVYGVAVTKPQG